MYSFGSGVLIGTQLGVANPTPINLGLVQNVTLDISVTTKELYGQYNFPVAIGSGTKKLTGKSTLAKISGIALGSLFFNQYPVVGQAVSQFGEVGTIPGTPYQITVANAATFVDDLGVIYAATGLPLKRVASAPTAGQYSLNTATGVYTFAAADTTLGVLISYTYTVTTAGTQKVQVSQALIGPTATFSANLFTTDPTTNKQFSIKLYSCVSTKLGLATKLEDFTMPDFEFSCFANAAGQVLDMNFGDAA